MKMSVQSKILVPIIVTILGGLGLAGSIAYQAISGQEQVEQVVRDSLHARVLSANIGKAFHEAAALGEQVLAMTTFVAADDIKSRFQASDDQISHAVEELKQKPLNAELGRQVGLLQDDYNAWRGDIRILLGLEKSEEVPTLEKLSRSETVFMAEVEKVDGLVNEAATANIVNAGDSLGQSILNKIIVAAIVASALGAGLVLFSRGLSRSITTITTVMDKLAKGDTALAIPYQKREDEIGSMAAAVEVFRRGAVERAQLEQQAEDARSEAETSRLAERQMAERDATARLQVATSGLASGLKRLASGDLAFQLDTQFSGEFEPLRNDFNLSVRQLADTLSAVSASITMIADGSREISHGSGDLSARTERQAAALEETSAAVNEITAKVNDASRIAGEARRAAHNANESAVVSGKVVSQAIDAMSQIEDSSRQITSIIAVIDQIAFQTNLLALNAGVEAARAGDAGKGFAVVAQEVRELAQRSATAAFEIKGLIGKATEDVGRGVQLVSETGGALRNIEDQVVIINGFMESLAISSRDQAAGLSEVNSAMRDMDNVTQQNAAMVEETTAASANLAAEAERLDQLIAQFKLDGAGQRLVGDKHRGNSHQQKGPAARMPPFAHQQANLRRA